MVTPQPVPTVTNLKPTQNGSRYSTGDAVAQFTLSNDLQQWAIERPATARAWVIEKTISAKADETTG